MNVPFRLLPAFLATLLGAASARGMEPVPAPVHSEVLADGLELLVGYVPGQSRASFRWVVRAGANFDPPGKGGLAHLLEHLVLQEERNPALWQAVGAAGARLNAFTTAGATVFALDAPVEQILPLAARLVAAITGPKFSRAAISPEMGVIDTEERYYGDSSGLLEELELELFPDQSGGVAGTAASRQAIEPSDLDDFFRKFYVTTNSTAILTGDVTPEKARELLRNTVLLPPATERDEVIPLRPAPRVPLDEKTRAPFTAAALGYLLEPRDEGHCPALAEAVEQKVVLEMLGRDIPFENGAVQCASLYGRELVVAYAFSRSMSATQVPEQLSRAFASVAMEPLSARDRSIVEKRMTALRVQARGNPEQLATSLAQRAARPRMPGSRTELSGPAFPGPAAISAAARRAFRPQNRVLVYFSPFEG